MNRTVLILCLLALASLGRAQVGAFDLKLTSVTRGDCHAEGCDSGLGCTDGSADCGAPVNGCADGECGTCEVCCSNRGTFFGEYESTFFRYHRANGVLIDMASPTAERHVEFDFEHTPRITFGYIGSGGFGVRARWWHYDHSESAADANQGALGVDTYNIDLEFFQTIDVGCATALEVSAGIRYNDFDENFTDGNGIRFINFNSSPYGGIFAVQVNRCVTAGSYLFARARGAALMGNRNVYDSISGSRTHPDTTQGMMEVTAGWEYVTFLGCFVVKATVAAEWQNWYNYSAAFDAGGPSVQGFASDVGFGGIVVGFGIEY